MSRARIRILQLAGYIGDNEPIPTFYEYMEMTDLVSLICAERDQSILRIATIAIELARAFDREYGAGS